MRELIDKGKLYDHFANLEVIALEQVQKHSYDEDLSEWHKWSAILQERTAYKFDVFDAPVEEAEPVRHGRWEVIFYDNIPKIAKCSECGEGLFFTKEDYPIRHISNYCPNCGAKMDEEEPDVTLN